MTKQKIPLLSFGASGTIAGTVTHQTRHGTKFARAKPVPIYRNTLQQQYQKWLYQDAIGYWETLTSSQKAAYRAIASRDHISIFSAFIRYYLTDLPDIVAGYHLDYRSGAVVPDFSRNSHHGVRIGATYIPGTIAQALNFDGDDDRVSLGSSPDLIPTPISIDFFFIPQSTGKGEYVLSKWIPGATPSGFGLRFWDNTWLRFDIADGLGGSASAQFDGLPFTVGTRYHICLTFERPVATLHANTSPRTKALDLALATNLATFYLATNHSLTVKSPMVIDHFVIYNRVLTDADILRHSERRYP